MRKYCPICDEIFEEPEKSELSKYEKFLNDKCFECNSKLFSLNVRDERISQKLDSKDKESLDTEGLLKTPTHSNDFPKPRKYNTQFPVTLKSKIKDFFDKHLVIIVISLAAVVLISILVFKANEKIDRGGDTKILTESEKSFEKIKGLASDVFHENDWCYTQWTFLANLKSAEDSYYGDKSVDVDLYPRELSDGRALISTSKIFIPSSEFNAIKDPVYGLPVSFFYKFYFDKQDSITAKYLAVVYSSGKTIDYDFQIRPVKLLINTKVALPKTEKWEKHRKQLADQQKQEQNKQEQKINESEQNVPVKKQYSSVSKKVFKFKSENYDIEKPGEEGYTTIYDPSYHTVDLINMVVQQKSMVNGKWVNMTYTIKSFYIEKGTLSTNYVLVINSMGLKEVWFSPVTLNLGYDYDDGTRIACYDLSEIR